MRRILAWGLACVLALVPVVAHGAISPNEQYEYLVGATAWQLSAESAALMQQAFATVKTRVNEMAARCADASDADWTYGEADDGSRQMLYRGMPVAIISDIDDTLVDGAHYTADIVGADGDYNNAAFARFVLSDGCTALPGAAECIRYCADAGIEVYYITNRYDQGYRIDQSDSVSSYAEVVGAQGEGQYIAADGTLIGTTAYQTLGMSFYDITLMSMARLGFPIDDQHLIMNDSKLYGESKQRARDAVRLGATDFPNGQRADGNATGSALTLSCPAHYVALLLGDQLGDFTDAFGDAGLDATTRAELTERYADKWGREWILLPNAVYGSAMQYAARFGFRELLAYYSYLGSTYGVSDENAMG